MLKLVWRFIPHFLKRIFLNLLSRVKWGVTIGRGSFVSLGCKFQHKNVILNDSFVAYSSFGKFTYVANNSKIVRAKIGSFSSIGDNVRTCVGRHPVNMFSSHPQTYSNTPPSGTPWVSESRFNEHLYNVNDPSYVVLIGNDVWIGNDVIIMDGVTIGDGAILAAGSVVVRDVEPYSIVGGVPAKHIKYRFGEESRRELLQLKWWDKSDDWILSHTKNLNEICEGSGLNFEK